MVTKNQVILDQAGTYDDDMSTIFLFFDCPDYLHLNNCEKDKQLLVSPPHDYTHTQCPTTHTWDMSTHLMVNGLLYLLPDFTTTLPSLSLKSRETMYSKTFTYLEVNSCVQNKTKTSLVITYQTEQFSILGSFLCVLRIWRRKKNYFEKCLYVRL